MQNEPQKSPDYSWRIFLIILMLILAGIFYFLYILSEATAGLNFL